MHFADAQRVTICPYIVQLMMRVESHVKASSPCPNAPEIVDMFFDFEIYCSKNSYNYTRISDYHHTLHGHITQSNLTCWRHLSSWFHITSGLGHWQSFLGEVDVHQQTLGQRGAKHIIKAEGVLIHPESHRGLHVFLTIPVNGGNI